MLKKEKSNLIILISFEWMFFLRFQFYIFIFSCFQMLLFNIFFWSFIIRQIKNQTDAMEILNKYLVNVFDVKQQQEYICLSDSCSVSLLLQSRSIRHSSMFVWGLQYIRHTHTRKHTPHAICFSVWTEERLWKPWRWEKLTDASNVSSSSSTSYLQ